VATALSQRQDSFSFAGGKLEMLTFLFAMQGPQCETQHFLIHNIEVEYTFENNRFLLFQTAANASEVTGGMA
jgi:hypothetical protein